MKRRVVIVKTISENKQRIVLHCGDTVYTIEEDKHFSRRADKVIVDYMSYMERHPNA